MGLPGSRKSVNIHKSKFVGVLDCVICFGGNGERCILPSNEMVEYMCIYIF